jgi:hypothetical protein
VRGSSGDEVEAVALPIAWLQRLGLSHWALMTPRARNPVGVVVVVGLHATRLHLNELAVMNSQATGFVLAGVEAVDVVVDAVLDRRVGGPAAPISASGLACTHSINER